MIEYILNLSDEEIAYICQQIGGSKFKKYYSQNPNKFAEIKPGFRVNSITDSEAVSLAINNKKKTFISSFINKQIEEWIREICECQKKEGLDADIALMKVLPDSYFCDNPDLYFKLCTDDYSDKVKAVIRTCCAVVSKQKKDLFQNEKNEYSTKIKAEAEENWQNERELYTNQIDDKNKELNEASENIRDRDETIAELESKNTLLSTELSNTKNLIDTYAPKHEEEHDDYDCKSVCEIYHEFGQIKLRRLADIINNKVTTNLDFDYYSNRVLYTKEQGGNDGEISIWNWKKIPNANDPSRDYIVSKRNEFFAPIEIMLIDDCNQVAEVVDRLIKGVNRISVFPKQFWCCLSETNTLIGVLCDSSNMDVSGLSNGTKIRDTVFQLPQYEIRQDDVCELENKKSLYKYSEMGFPQEKVSVKDPLDIVKAIFEQHITWGGMKPAGFSRTTYQEVKKYIDNLPTKDIFQEIENECQCTHEEAERYFKQFESRLDKYIQGNDLYSESLYKVVCDHPELLSSCKKNIEADWEIEHSDKVDKANRELMRLSSESNNLRSEIENAEKSLNEELKKINDKKELANNIEPEVQKRISKAREDAAGFVADMVFIQPMQQESNDKITECQEIREKKCFYCPGISLPEESLEKNETIQDFISTLRYELVDEGVAEKYSVILGTYMYSLYVNKMPIILAGPCAKEIANAFSASVCGRTTGTLLLQGDYSDEEFKKALSSEDKIVTINNVFCPQWQQLISNLSRHDKYFIATTEYSDDLLIEPKEFIDYCVPVFTELFIDEDPVDKYVGAQYNPNLFELEKTKCVADYRLLKMASLCKYTKNRISKAIATAQSVLKNDIDNGEFLLCVLPVLMLHSKNISTMLDKITDDESISPDIKDIIKTFIGIEDE